MGTQALILAAGRGSRLGMNGGAPPKCLLEVGRRHLYEHQFEALSEAGVGPIHMVLGYCADEIREVVGVQAEYVLNPRWNVTNSLYSFWLARDEIDGPVMILNCDVLFHPRIVNKLLEAGGDAIAFDSSSGEGREHMKVRVADGALVDMSKSMPAEHVAGENVGILSLTAETARELFDLAGKEVQNGGEKKWLGAAVRKLAAERKLRMVDIAGLPWGEIDFPYDLDRVRKQVWPSIQASTSRWSRAWRVTRWVVALVLLGALGFFAWRGWSPQNVNWSTVDIDGCKKIKISVLGKRQKWWVIEKDRVARIRVEGPGPLRIQTRPILPDGTTIEVPYVIEVRMDGERLDWFKIKARVSGKAAHDEWTLGKRERTILDIPPGTHNLEVRLIASDTGKCLVRIREVDPEPDIE